MIREDFATWFEQGAWWYFMSGNCHCQMHTFPTETWRYRTVNTEYTWHMLSIYFANFPFDDFLFHSALSICFKVIIIILASCTVKRNSPLHGCMFGLVTKLGLSVL